MTPRVAIAIPHHAGEIHICIVRTLTTLDLRGIAVTVMDHALTSVAVNRNLLVQRFLDDLDGLTHVFFLDSDVGVPPSGLQKLLAANAPIVTGLYVDKRRLRLVARRRLGPFDYAPMDEEWCLPPEQAGGAHWIIRPELRDRVLPCDGAGAGCLLVRRDVFERVRYPWFAEQFDPAATRHGDSTALSEDLSFFAKAAEAGFPGMAHTGVLCDHWAGVNKFPPSWEPPIRAGVSRG